MDDDRTTSTAAAALRLLAPDSPDEWPAGILAAADMRQARATCASPSPWTWDGEQEVGGPDFADGSMRGVAECFYDADAEHIAAEASPVHALAAVDHWRGVAHRHRPLPADPRICNNGCPGRYPCDDLAEVADEARAYLGGAA